MTTWHESETIDEVAEFFALNASFDNFVAKNFLVLFIGTNKELEQQAAKTVKGLLNTRAA